MDKHTLLKILIEQNDTKLKNKEDQLIVEVNQAYKKAITKATEEFKALEKVSSDTKVNSEEVKKILARMIGSFRAEFEVIISPFQKELENCYDEALEESALLVASSMEEKI